MAQNALMQKVAQTLFATTFILGGTSAMAEDIGMTIEGVTYRVALLENDAAKSLIEKLPLEVSFEDYGSTERIAYPNGGLSTGGAPRRTTPVRGDITYYAPWGNLAVFIHDFRLSEGLVPLGHMDDKAVDALKTSGKAKVRFERLE